MKLSLTETQLNSTRELLEPPYKVLSQRYPIREEKELVHLHTNYHQLTTSGRKENVSLQTLLVCHMGCKVSNGLQEHLQEKQKYRCQKLEVKALYSDTEKTQVISVLVCHNFLVTMLQVLLEQRLFPSVTSTCTFSTQSHIY